MYGDPTQEEIDDPIVVIDFQLFFEDDEDEDGKVEENKGEQNENSEM